MKLRKLFVVLAVALFALANISIASAEGIAALEKEANKVVAGKFPNTKKDASDRSLSLGYIGQQGIGFQFTVSSDKEPGVPDAEKMEYKGKKAFFFRPLGESSGAIMVMLTPEKSLVLFYNLGMFSDDEVTKEMMIAFLDKMDLEAIK